MLLTDERLATAKEHPFVFEGKAGALEAILTVPSALSPNYIALLGHPHSLQGGSMSNKVVTTLARAFKDLGIPSIRFNFRGVGKSAGSYDAGIGESEDMLELMRLCQGERPNLQFLFAGFSFGSYVSYRAAALAKASFLISVAPAVHHYDYHEFSHIPQSWSIMQGDEDEVVPLNLVVDFANSFNPPLPLYQFAETSHFFHGKLLELKDRVSEVISAKVSE